MSSVGSNALTTPRADQALFADAVGEILGDLRGERCRRLVTVHPGRDPYGVVRRWIDVPALSNVYGPGEPVERISITSRR